MQLKLDKLKAGSKNLLAKLQSAFKQRNNLVLVAVIVAPAVILSVTLAFVFKPAEYSLDDLALLTSSVDPSLPRHPLTGEVLEQELETLPQVFGVMIENSADAWPLAGIDQAFLVIEAPVEGGIPRFLAFFSAEEEVNNIGPVRSARPYFLTWNHELDGVYAHVGGSPQALSDILELEMHDLNEFSQGEYFWRDSRRSAPHNIYTSTVELNRALLELKPAPPSYASWLFKTEQPIDPPILEDSQGDDRLSLKVDWGQGSLYDIKWRYQTDTNTYIRLQNNRIVKSADNQQIFANNIVVMAADMAVIDGIGRLRLDNLGAGDALLVQDGKIILGTWAKATSEARVRFYDSEGVELKFNPGITWIEVVPSLDKVSTVSDL